MFAKVGGVTNTVVTFVNVIFFLCKSMQICCLVIGANRTSACKSPFANLFSPCKSLFGNHCVACKSVAFSDENRCNSNSNDIFSHIQSAFTKNFLNVSFTQYSCTLIYVTIILSERIEKISKASKLQTIKRWNYYAKGYLRICTAWTSWGVDSTSEFFKKHCCIFELETDLQHASETSLK